MRGVGGGASMKTSPPEVHVPLTAHRSDRGRAELLHLLLVPRLFGGVTHPVFH